MGVGVNIVGVYDSQHGSLGDGQANRASISASFQGAQAAAAALNFGEVEDAGFGLTVATDGKTPKPTSATASIDGASCQGFQGIAQVGQNAGAGSAIQNATALAVVRPLKGTQDQDKLALAVGANFGSVNDNHLYNDSHNTSASVNGSMNGMRMQVSLGFDIATYLAGDRLQRISLPLSPDSAAHRRVRRVDQRTGRRFAAAGHPVPAVTRPVRENHAA